MSMAGFFDRFKDLDSLKEQAEKMVQDSAKEARRQAELGKLRLRILDLERRMNAEFRVLGERVWDLHEREAVAPENLTGAFDLLEALASEIDDAKADMEALVKAKEADAAAAKAAREAEAEAEAEDEPETEPVPAAPPPVDDIPAARKIEPAEEPDDPPLE